MRNRIVSLCVVFTAFVLCTPHVYSAGPFDSSIVRVTVTRYSPNVLQPWTKANADDASATGFLIENKRVLTNAHVVQYASQIYVQPDNSPEKFEAKVVISAPEIDLAVLSIEDETFFENRKAIPMLDGLPKLKSPVNVYGYPLGGEQLSVTEGIISRIDFTALQLGGAGLRVQIDAALNPGNSGAPAISEGKLVGVAFQVMQQAENVGFLISIDEVKLFLDDIVDGVYDGKAQFFGEVQTVENDALRFKLGLPKGSGGALVTRVSRIVPDYPLRVGDVITHVGDSALDQTAKVKVTDELSLPFHYLAPKLARDKKLRIKVLRDGKPLEIDIPTAPRDLQLVRTLRGTYPRYFILGPLVFSVGTHEFLAGIGPQWGGVLMARRNPILTRLLDEPNFLGEELVVLSSPMFPHKITKGYGQAFGAVVGSVNGTPVKNLTHLVELLRDSSGDFLEIDFVDRGTEKLVFRRKEIMAATEEILSNNGIRKQYSDDLAAIWEKK
jgi:S1-C subfamily serine protease